MPCQSDYAALLRAVLESPDDDAPRLILADWLDEAGAAVPAAHIRQETPRPSGSTSFYVAHWVELDKWLDLARWPALFDHERGFIGGVHMAAADFLAHAADLFAAHPIARVTLTDRRPRRRETVNHGPLWCWWESSLWPAYGTEDIPAEIAECFEPYTTSWLSFGSEADALAALSLACVRHGRELAGLPEYIPAPEPAAPSAPAHLIGEPSPANYANRSHAQPAPHSHR